MGVLLTGGKRRKEGMKGNRRKGKKKRERFLLARLFK